MTEVIDRDATLAPKPTPTAPSTPSARSPSSSPPGSLGNATTAASGPAAMTAERDERPSAADYGQLNEDYQACQHSKQVFFDSWKRTEEELAAAQAREAKLRELIVKTTTEDMHGKEFRICCSSQTSDDHAAHCILALPNDDSALQERLAAERERCAKELGRLNYPNFAHAAICIRSMK